MRILTALGVNTLLGVFALNAQAGGLPLVISATVDYSLNTLTISGQNFGTVSAVTLDSLAFTAASSSPNQIVANFPSGKAPSSFLPGTYFLTVTFKNQLPSVFAVDIGASGVQGPAGPAGAPGAPGVAGALGPSGPAGPQGIPGPMGPVGATGAAGATGAQGLQGVAGPVGTLGPVGPKGDTGLQGPKGDPGAPGINGAGVPVCDASNPYLVIANGTMVCQPRYVDNNDNTVTDNQTSLMWEKHNNQQYQGRDLTFAWSQSGTAADGVLYTAFLSAVNSDVTPNGLDTPTSNITSCLANHCDWRIPTLVELKTILLTQTGQCATSPCIDPVFGPTGPYVYWSSTTVNGLAVSAFGVDFGSGFIFWKPKTTLLSARAVRSLK